MVLLGPIQLRLLRRLPVKTFTPTTPIHVSGVFADWHQEAKKDMTLSGNLVDFFFRTTKAGGRTYKKPKLRVQ